MQRLPLSSFCADGVLCATLGRARCRQCRQIISLALTQKRKKTLFRSAKGHVETKVTDTVWLSLWRLLLALDHAAMPARSFGQQPRTSCSGFGLAITWPHGPFHSSTQAGKRPRSRGTAHSKSSCSTSRLLTRRGHTFKSMHLHNPLMHLMHRGRAQQEVWMCGRVNPDAAHRNVTSPRWRNMLSARSKGRCAVSLLRS